VKARALGFAALLTLTACGSAATVDSSSSSSTELDRSDPEQVAVAMVTALLESDFDTVRSIVVPDQRDDVAAIEQAAELGPSPDVEIVSVTATVLSDDGATAVVDYSGEYCLPATADEVPVTAVGSEGGPVETIPGSSLVGPEPEQCFDLDDFFQTDHVELTRIDGSWYAPLPR
jgi:hypothetical protein